VESPLHVQRSWGLFSHPTAVIAQRGLRAPQRDRSHSPGPSLSLGTAARTRQALVMDSEAEPARLLTQRRLCEKRLRTSSSQGLIRLRVAKVGFPPPSSCGTQKCSEGEQGFGEGIWGVVSDLVTRNCCCSYNAVDAHPALLKRALS